jgi:hypothetical protein
MRYVRTYVRTHEILTVVLAEAFNDRMASDDEHSRHSMITDSADDSLTHDS